MVRYRSRADECYVGDGGVRCKIVGDIRPADDRLHDIGRMTAGFEGASSDRGEVRRGPGGGFRALDNDGVAGEDGGYDWTYKIVELANVRYRMF